ncbi:hypothetical protein MUK42_37707 [Musa troglodytarum]|uniref:Uncharacterized protein n=1 Tax=Musa troglodytarum TaxID=320322 RepID=A0A9E7EGM1_9LILI|nr:hypothetical protein MUK42_37707 [Musa troglodytarum]
MMCGEGRKKRSGGDIVAEIAYGLFDGGWEMGGMVADRILGVVVGFYVHCCVWIVLSSLDPSTGSRRDYLTSLRRESSHRCGAVVILIGEGTRKGCGRLPIRGTPRWPPCP